MHTALRTASYRLRVFITLGVVVLAAAVIIACGSTSANTGTKVTGSDSGSQTQASASHFKVGDQVKVGDTYVVTVNSIKTSAGDDFDKPKDGNTYVIVDVTTKNVSSKEQDLSSLLQFTLKDSSGQKYTETIVSGATPPDGKIAASDLLKGQLAYEVPASMHDFTLAFQGDIISGGQTIWDLHV